MCDEVDAQCPFSDFKETPKGENTTWCHETKGNAKEIQKCFGVLTRARRRGTTVIKKIIIINTKGPSLGISFATNAVLCLFVLNIH